MARLVGVDLPRRKKIRFALTAIFGIGPTLSKQILDKVGIDHDTSSDHLTESDVARLKDIIETHYQVEGDLRRMEGLNVKRLIEIGSYRGQRHRKGLPCRGQRTKTNARTRRGKRGGSPVKKRA